MYNKVFRILYESAMLGCQQIPMFLRYHYAGIRQQGDTGIITQLGHCIKYHAG